MPRVSVILTSFNHEPFLGQAINSVLQQSFTDHELVILDDASSDGSWSLISSVDDARVSARRSERPGQIVHLINQAIADASGEFIAIHHSDDIWMPEKLERQVAYLDAHPEVGATFTWAQVIDEHGNKVRNEWLNPPERSRWELLRHVFDGTIALCQPTLVARKRCYEQVGVYRYGLGQTDDGEFWSRLLLHYPVQVLEERLIQLRRFTNRSNVSGQRPEVYVRIANEFNFLRENYLALSSFDDFVRVFPEFSSWRRSDGCNMKFLLAIACITNAQPNAWQLGLRWLYEILNDEAARNQVAQLYGFSDLDYIELSAALDSYMLGATRRNLFALEEFNLTDQGVLPGYETLATRLAQRNAALQKTVARQAWPVWRLHRACHQLTRRVVRKLRRTLGW
ncbi:glycosyltransferase family 2 protein [Castellaniella sp.]|uniref:glycosyltransferase family 2 protein n=1 Tax=Castellaniella sp. TaxID=1955812 RepID=UPI00355CAC0F